MSKHQNKKASAFCESLLSQWKELFSKKDDTQWKEWVNFQQREWRDLITVLNGDFRQGFKARALFNMLVPDLNWSPIYWKSWELEQGRFDSMQSCSDRIDFKTLDLKLQQFAAHIVGQFIVRLEKEDFALKEYNQFTFTRIRSTYNDLIIHLLIALPVEHGHALFELFSLNDLEAGSNTDDCTGYNPFRALLFTPGVPYFWKVQADKQMREIIVDELSGKRKPRADWEEAIGRYADHIHGVLYEKRSADPESVRLFADQLDFLIRLPGINKRAILRSFYVDQILTLVSESHTLQRDIALFVVIGNCEPLKIYDEKDLKLAKRILSILSKSGVYDSVIAPLETMIEEGGRNLTQKLQHSKSRKKTEETILAQMK